MAPKKLPELVVDKHPFDDAFLAIFTDLCEQSVANVADCTRQVFELSASFVSKDASKVLKQFYELYFATGKVQAQKEKVNKDVDDLIDQIQAKMAAGQEITSENVVEDEAKKTERLGLSGLQKQLEGLITLDEGIKERIMPALSSMQFEDAARQRIEHLTYMWDLAVNASNAIDTEILKETIAEILSSAAETKIYYEIVLKREPPKVIEENVWFFDKEAS
ncbi:MAG: hypothetical protein AB7T49_11820 [Oligoflexales bacterium]